MCICCLVGVTRVLCLLAFFFGVCLCLCLCVFILVKMEKGLMEMKVGLNVVNFGADRSTIYS